MEEQNTGNIQQQLKSQNPLPEQSQQTNQKKANRKDSQGTWDTFNQEQKEKMRKKEHEQYMKEKQARRKQIKAAKEKQYGLSSSQQEEIDPKTVAKLIFQEDAQLSIKAQTTASNIKKIQAQKEQFRSSASSAGKLFQIRFMAKKSKIWEPAKLEVGQQSIRIDDQDYIFLKIDKLKIYQAEIQHEYIKLKFNMGNTEIFMGASTSQKDSIEGMTQHYYVFASILERKLAQLGVKAKPNLQISIPNIDPKLLDKSVMQGKLLRKKMLGGWEERVVVMTNQGLVSYRKANEKYSEIPKKAIKQLWTRFEREGELLVVKLINQKQKEEYAIPVVDFKNTKNWLYHFYTLCMIH